MILGVTGLARSGKDSFADFIVKNYGFVKVNMSDCLRDELLAMGKEPSKDNMSILGDDWRSKWGKDIVLKRTLKDAKRLGNVVITGFRSVEEVDFIRKECPDFLLVALVASEEVRFGRKTKEDPQDFESFVNRDRRDIKNKGLDRVLALADHVIDNDSNGWELHGKARDFFTSL